MRSKDSRRAASIAINAPCRARPSRRAFLGAIAGAVLGASGLHAATDRNTATKARRPRPPYRVWFQPRLFQRDLDLYADMTIDASGWLDPRLAELAGKTALDWVYGLNHPYADGPDYWRDACSPQSRGRPKQNPEFISAGIAIDEWVPPKLPNNERWLAQGLRAGREANPDVFIAIWSTDPTPTLLDLAKEGTADLIIVQGYTHTHTHTHSVMPGLTTSWEGGLRRCETLAEAGLANKTIFCFGHVTDRANSRGEHLNPAWLRERAEEMKQRYPEMPGVAFFQSADPETPELRDLVRFCDRLSGELWPDTAAPGP